MNMASLNNVFDHSLTLDHSERTKLSEGLVILSYLVVFGCDPLVVCFWPYYIYAQALNGL